MTDNPQKTVCQRIITTKPEHLPRATYQGRVIYFCTEFCFDAFNADPDRFYIAHSKTGSPKTANHQPG